MKWLNRLLTGSFVKFAVVGGLGTITNLLLFLLLADKLHWPALLVSVLSFSLAVSQNYVLNSLWTFSPRDWAATAPQLSWRRYFLFVASSLVGLGVNLAVLYLLLRLHPFHYKTIPQAAGILCGLVLNYLLSKRLVFK